MATESLVIKFRADGTRAVVRGINSIRDAARSASAATSQLTQTLKSIDSLQIAQTGLARSGVKASNSQAQLAAAATQSQTSVSRLARSNKELGATYKNTGKASQEFFGVLRKGLVAIGTVIVVKQTIQSLTNLIDSYTALQNSLRIVTDSTFELNQVYAQLVDISKETRSSISVNAELFRRLALSSKELGVSQGELLQFTKNLNQAIKIGGSTSEEAANGIIQLSQGLASGALRGDELRSVLEQLPVVADIIAKSMGKTRGELRKLGAEGKITSDIIIRSIGGAGRELSERFGKTVPLISDSFVRLGDSLRNVVGAFDRLSGSSQAVANALNNIADTVESFTPENIVRAYDLIVEGQKTAAKDIKATNLTSLVAKLFILSRAGTAAVAKAEAERKFGLEDYHRSQKKVNDEERIYGQLLRTTGPIIGKLTDQQEKLNTEIEATLAGQSVEQFKAETAVRESLTKANVLLALSKLKVIRTGYEELEANKVRLDLLKQLLEPQRKEALVRQELNKLAEKGFDVSKLEQKLLKEKTSNIDRFLNSLKEEAAVAGLSQAAGERRAAVLEATNALVKDGADLESTRSKSILASVEATVRATQVDREYASVLEEHGISQDQNRLREEALNKALLNSNLTFDQRRSLLAELNDLTTKSTDFISALKQAFLDTNLSAKVLGITIGEYLVSTIDKASGALADFIVTGARDVETLREQLANIFQDLGKQILQLIIKTLILKAIQASLGGTSLGGTSLGGTEVKKAQAGGFLQKGRPALIGERGPEVFVPTESGRVVPNNNINVSPPQVNVRVVNVQDPNEVTSAINTPAGEAAVLNVLRKNRKELARLS